MMITTLIKPLMSQHRHDCKSNYRHHDHQLVGIVATDRCSNPQQNCQDTDNSLPTDSKFDATMRADCREIPPQGRLKTQHCRVTRVGERHTSVFIRFSASVGPGFRLRVVSD